MRPRDGQSPRAHVVSESAVDLHHTRWSATVSQGRREKEREQQIDRVSDVEHAIVIHVGRSAQDVRGAWHKSVASQMASATSMMPSSLASPRMNPLNRM